MMRTIVTLIFICLVTTPVTAEDNVDLQLRRTPLEVLTHSYTGLGLKREELVELGKLSGLVHGKTPRMDRTPLGEKVKAPDRSKDLKWQEVQQLVHDVLSDDKRGLHQQYCFQYIVGLGMLDAAIRYAGAEPPDDTEKMKAEYLKASTVREKKSKLDEDRIYADVLAKFVSKSRMKQAVGPFFKVKSRSLSDSFAVDSSFPSLRLLRIAALPRVQIELECSVGQKKQIDKTLRLWIKKLGVELAEGFHQGEMEFHPGDKDFEDVPAVEAEIDASAKRMLDPPQYDRLKQIYLRNLVAVRDLRRTSNELGLEYNAEMKSALRDVGREIYAAQHLRAFAIYSPIVQARMEKEKFDELTRSRFIPHDPFGVSPVLTSSAFSDFGVRKKQDVNRRRGN